MISVDKNYRTRSGTIVHIYAIHPDQKLEQVHGALVYPDFIQMQTWDINGRFTEKSDEESILDLVEVSPYADWKIDDKVVVWDNKLFIFDRHFAGVDEKSGDIIVYPEGRTSWTTCDDMVNEMYSFGILAEDQK